MNKFIFRMITLGILTISLNAFADESNAQNSFEARYAYTMGYRIGQSLKTQGIKKLDANNILSGINDSLEDREPRLDEAEMHDAIPSYLQYLKELRKKDSKGNLLEADAFLEKNKSRTGVFETPSGLQYEIIKPAQGKRPTLHSSVQVHYHGTFINGDVFDSSVQLGKPAEFKLGEAIPGFSEAITNMHVGEKWRIFVPPALGYGVKGVKGLIGSNEMLIFEIELLSII